MRIAFVRHGPTEWNAQGRIQGRLDLPLSAEGRARMARLGPPKGFVLARAYSSPLGRARETAVLLGFPNPVLDARLAEHHWGRWEGLTRDEILARDGEDAFTRAGSGADFTPPEGERTADLIARVRSFLDDIAKTDTDAIAITHRGVLRSAYTIATGWKMLTPMPDQLDLSKALVLEMVRDGSAKITALNVALSARTDRGA
jgi:probable phosphoglycerate mutase